MLHQLQLHTLQLISLAELGWVGAGYIVRQHCWQAGQKRHRCQCSCCADRHHFCAQEFIGGGRLPGAFGRAGCSSRSRLS